MGYTGSQDKKQKQITAERKGSRVQKLKSENIKQTNQQATWYSWYTTNVAKYSTNSEHNKNGYPVQYLHQMKLFLAELNLLRS